MIIQSMEEYERTMKKCNHTFVNLKGEVIRCDRERKYGTLCGKHYELDKRGGKTFNI